jgi:anti-anti-sigma factor
VDHDNRPSPPFRLERSAGRVTLVVLADLDLSTAEEVLGAADQVWSHGTTEVVVDLRARTFFGATGVRLLERILAAAPDPGCRLRVVTPSPVVLRILAIARLTHVVHDPDATEPEPDAAGPAGPVREP